MINRLETFAKLLKFCGENNLKIFEACQLQEATEQECNISKIREQANEIINVMRMAVNNGLNSDELSASKMTGNDCQKLQKHYETTNSIVNDFQKKVLLYSLATAEENARMGKIAACPTAGACGIVPAIILASTNDKEKQIDALITSGQIGKIISNKVALAGAVMGCQGECGSAAAMASAALVYLNNGTNEQIINAVALTLKNILGLVCDPIAGLVEVPCVKRNPFMSMVAITGAELSLSGIKSVVPTDEVVDAMCQIGTFMSPQLKESSEAGLATTKTGISIAKKMQNQI